MFERRVQIIAGAFVLALLVLVGRLFQLQIVHGGEYREAASRALVLEPRSLPFVRGSILDRNGTVLVRDEPAWDLRIDFAAIRVAHEAEPSDQTLKFAERYASDLARARGSSASLRTADRDPLTLLYDAIAQTWEDLGALSTETRYVSPNEVRDRAGNRYQRIMRIRDIVARRRGFDAPVAEERTSHTILADLSPHQQIVARETLSRYPWLHVERSSERKYVAAGESLAHVLGRVRNVDAETVADDPTPDDPFARYEAGEVVGSTGIEHVAERTLRGRRGQITVDRDGETVEGGLIEAMPGTDVKLTLDLPLQRRIYALLEEAVESVPESSGGSAVVIHAPTREVLALVSYPGYDPSAFQQDYERLRDDTEKLPLIFRAVANRYAPGSTVKPLICLQGLMTDVINLSSRIECTGYLFEEVRDAWRCWQVYGSDRRMAHGAITAEEALVGSCNIFMYRLGEQLGVDRICSAFDMVGVGKTTRLGFREENEGINPTPSWLMTYKNMPVTAGTARQFAIGQGEVSLTPVQVANLMATYATGTWQPLQILLGEENVPPKWTLRASRDEWIALRRGMYGVVNDMQHGTAARHVPFRSDKYVICGKTGSATAHPWPTAYRVSYSIPTETGDFDRRVATLPAGSARDAADRFAMKFPSAIINENVIEVARRWPRWDPPEGERFSHAWFGGFLQPRTRIGSPNWDAEPPFAFAAMVEFGGSGGRTSGPLGAKIAKAVLERFDLDQPTIATDWQEAP